MSEYMLRDAEEGDIDALMELENACFAAPWIESAVLREIGVSDAEFLAACACADIIGFCIARLTGYSAELFQIAVAAEHRRRGVSSAMLRELIARLRRRRVRELFLEVRVSNEGAMAMYDKFGFERVGLRRNYYDKPREDAAVMRLEIGA